MSRNPSISSLLDSFSSLPDLIPIQDHSDTSSNSVVDQNSHLSHTDPPQYSESTNNPPEYHTIRSRELVLRRIRILERHALGIRQEILENHHRNISRITSETERLLEDHNSTLGGEINTLHASLNL